MKNLITLLISTLITMYSFSQTGFGSEQVIEEDQPLFISDIVTTDFNGDGEIDIVYGTIGDFCLKYLKGIGDGSFDIADTIATPGAIFSLVTADIDNDGDFDLIGGADNEPPESIGLFVLKNNGDGFDPIEAISSDGQFIDHLTILDFNDDGALDIIFTKVDFTNDNQYISYNDGNGNFGSPVLLIDSKGANYAITDFNGDGFEDVVSYTNLAIYYHENDGIGNFLQASLVDSSEALIDIAYSLGLKHLDVNNDGHQDLIVRTKSYFIELAYYLNDGIGNFGSKQIISNNGELGGFEVELADLDNDGFGDVIFGGHYILNNGFGGFKSPQFFDPSPNANYWFRSSATDIDQDGDFDVILSDGHGNLSLFENLFGESKIEGKVFVDEVENCQHDVLEQNLNRFIIKAQQGNETFYALTDVNGNYELYTNDLGSFVINVELNSSLWASCVVDSILFFEESVLQELDFPVNKVVDCPLLNVDITAPFLRHCSESRYYVNYSNLGTVSVDSAYIVVQLDSLTSFVSASIPVNIVDSRTLEFLIDTIDFNSSENFTINVDLSCDAEIGQNQCAQANIYPDDRCAFSIDGWDGSSLVLATYCEGDSVKFRITNVGVGDMANPRNYFVTEDQIIFREGEIQLNGGEFFEFSKLATGITYHIKASQPIGHPGSDNVYAFVEGCQDEFVPSELQDYYFQDEDSHGDYDCQQIVGPFDPNDKNTNLKGYGKEHFIEANTLLEYKIRFQNVGSDTAFNVVIIDTLSELLNPASIIPTTSSHEYHMDLSSTGVLTFAFENIQLPDSTTNLEGSNGFVSFRINHIENIEIGDVIENKALIYFDFNAAVVTNKVYHTIGKNFIEKNITLGHNPITYVKNLSVYPNPSTGFITINIKGVHSQTNNINVSLFNLEGKEVLNENHSISERELQLNLNQLPIGIYNIKLTGDDILYQNQLKVVLFK